MEITRVNTIIEQLEDAFQAIQQPRSDYQLQNFVVGEKDTAPAQWAQCVLEMQVKHSAIRRSIIAEKKLNLEIGQLLKTGDEMDELTAEEKQVDLDDLLRARLGALREFATLYSIYQGFDRDYTYEEIQAAQTDYWHARLTRQAQQDVQAFGRVSVGNIDAMRQTGGITTYENGHLQIGFKSESCQKSLLSQHSTVLD